MNLPIDAAANPQAEQTYRKITRRLIPFLFLCYVFAFLDRVNVGIAQLDMKHDVGFSDLTYSIGAGIFFLGYVLMEVPSNLLLTKIGVKRTFSRIMVSVSAMHDAAVQSPLHPQTSNTKLRRISFPRGVCTTST